MFVNRARFSQTIVKIKSIIILDRSTSHSINKSCHTKCFKRIRMEECVKSRSNPIITKMDSPEFKSIFTPELEALSKLFQKYNFEIRIAGGAVRDLLLGKKPKDLDFATTATPQQMKEIFTTEDIRMINMNGEKHGTITPRINDKENFEITTLRIDIATDGRFAEVVFTTDWKLDANRRDLTINSMFLGLDGTVYDYFYGFDDLKVKKVAFVGSADTRIKEDYLRILRYFRFYGRISAVSNKHDDETLRVIAANIDGLQRVSGERIWMELKKILDDPMGGDLMLTMLHCGIAPSIGLPDTYNSEEFYKVWEANKNKQPEERIRSVALLVALLNDKDEMLHLHNRLRFSVYERDLGYFLIENRKETPSIKPKLVYQKLILNSSKKFLESKSMTVELLKYQNKLDILEFIVNWQPPKLPITGNHLKENGVSNGKQIGLVMKKLKNLWAENDFNLSTTELIKSIPLALAEVKKESLQKIN